MCINGRTYLGNTPTLVAGTTTKMKFGVVGMGSDLHTFHIHGHRWIVPGPSGTTASNIQTSPQNHPVSQFEDTRIFGPANSFTFTINGNAGSFMRAGGPSLDDSKGEWHLHCHSLAHMMSGMMGSLLIVGQGDAVTALAVGDTCDNSTPTPPPPQTHNISMHGNQFLPPSLSVRMGETVHFVNNDSVPHSVVWDTPGSPAGSPPTISPTGGSWDVVMPTMGTFNYHCGIHGPSMSGSINVTM